MVCPSDDAEAFADDYYSLPFQTATGSYALSAGSHGPSYGNDPLSVKMFNNGMFVYKHPRKIQDVSDGLSKTMLVSEVIEAHTAALSNIWSLYQRHTETYRTSENPINTPPGQGTLLTGVRVGTVAPAARRCLSMPPIPISRPNGS